MSQNVTNNWFQKLGTDSNFLDRQSSGKSVAKSGSTFQSFLSQQVKKSTPSNLSTKTEVSSSATRETSTLKRMDTTASKLSVKSPEKMTTNRTNEKVDSKLENDGNVQQKVDTSTEKTKDSVNSKTEGIDEAAQTNPTKDDKDVVELSEVAPELLQMIQSLPQDVVQQLPEDMQALLASVTEQLQNLLKSTTEVSSEGNGNGNKVLTLDMNNKQANEPLLSEKLVGTLKQLIDQLKTTEKSSPELTKSFENVLEQLKSEITQGEVAKPTTNTQIGGESKTNQNSIEASTPSIAVTANSNAGSNGGEVKSDLNENASNQSFGTDTKTVKETKVEVKAETKSDNETTVHNFSAKAEASSIAFGKQEVATQTVKSALHTNIMDQIINSPKLQIKQTEQGATMTLKLNPEVLGNVEIKMEIVKGVLQAEINVENMIVKGAIESSLADLKNALSDKGYQVETLNVSVGQDGRQSQQHHQQERQTSERTAMFTPEELEAINSSYDFDTVVNDTRIDYLG